MDTNKLRANLPSWGIVFLFVAAFWVLFALIDMPSPALFGALVGAMFFSVWGRFPSVTVNRPFFLLGQGLLGAIMGAYVDLPTLKALADHWVVVFGGSVSIILFSLFTGQLLAKHPDVSKATGTFSMIAGGASGITAIARELGADDRLVGVLQYLRILLIVFTTPLIASFIFKYERVEVVPSTDIAQPWQLAIFLTASVVIGILLVRFIPFTASTMLWPLLVAATISVSGVLGDVYVPSPVATVAYLLIGLQVGLRFTRSSLIAIRKIFPYAFLLMILLNVASALIGVVMSKVTGIGALDAYLATTPGGIWAIVGVALESGSDVTFILSVQVLRLMLVLFMSPFLANYFRKQLAKENAANQKTSD